MSGSQLLLLCGVIYVARGMNRTASVVIGLLFLIAASIEGIWRSA